MSVCGQIAVDQGFGGIDSKQKALWLISVVVDFFRDNGFELIYVFHLLVMLKGANNAYYTAFTASLLAVATMTLASVYWTTHGYAIWQIAQSQTSQLANAKRVKLCKL